MRTWDEFQEKLTLKTSPLETFYCGQFTYQLSWWNQTILQYPPLPPDTAPVSLETLPFIKKLLSLQNR